MTTVSIGVAILELAANTARINTDLGKALGAIDRFKKSAEKALAVVGVGVSIDGFVSIIKGAIDAADNLNNLQRRTGVAANELLILQGAAKRSGVDMDAVSDVASKLSKRLAQAATGTGDAANGFKAIGVSVTDARGNLKGVDQILGEVGKKFQGYEDGANKAAIATATLGKGGDRLIPMVEAIEETRKRFEALGITIEQKTLRASEQFNHTLEDLHSVLGVVATNLAAQMLPQLQNIADAMVTLAKHGAIIETVFNGMVIVVKVLATGFLTLATVIAAAGDALVGLQLAQLQFLQGNFKAAFDELSIGAGKAKGRVDDLADTVSALFAPANDIKDPLNKVARVDAPRLPDLAGAKAAGEALAKLQDDRAKRALDAIKRATDQEQALQDRYYADNLLSDERYWSQKISIAKGALDSELAVIDQQLKRQQGLADKAPKGSKQYNDALNDLETTQAKRNQLEQEFRNFAEVTYLDAEKAAKNYSDEVARLSVEMLELTGRTADAARVGQLLQNRDLRQKFSVNGDQQALDTLSAVEKLKAIQAKYNEVSEKTGLIFDDLAIKEERIQNARRVGAISELEALKRTDDARKQSVVALDAQYDATRRIAEEWGNPKILQDTDKLKLKIDGVAAESDLLAEKFDTVFKDSFSDNIAEAVSGTKSLSDAFRDMANSIVQQISRIAAQDIASQVFGKAGGGSGPSAIGEFFGKLFSGGGSAGVPFGPTPSGGNIFKPFAMGADEIPHDMIARLHKGERVVSAAENRRGSNDGAIVINNTFNTTGQMDSRSRTQLAAMVGDEVRRAHRNR